MKLFQLTTFLDQADLDTLRGEAESDVLPPIICRILEDMLENVEVIDDELTYSDDSRLNGIQELRDD